MVYAATISSPFVVSALFIFGATGFANFQNSITDLIPLPSATDILGIDNDLVDAVIDFIELLYDLLEKGIVLVVDLVLGLPDGSEFQNSIRSQFSGCVISLFFMVSSFLESNTQYHTE